MTAQNNERPVLIAYDGSECARRAIAEAASLFPSRRAIVVSVWQDVAAMPSFAWAAPASLTGLQDMLDVAGEGAERLAHEGAGIATHAGLSATPEAVEASGSIPEAIVRRADEDDVAASRAQLERSLAGVTEIVPVSLAVFGGAIDPARLRFPFNRMPASDARDWDAIRAWAAEIAPLVAGRAAVAR